jgi:hypothetical protein
MNIALEPNLPTAWLAGPEWSRLHGTTLGRLGADFTRRVSRAPGGVTLRVVALRRERELNGGLTGIDELKSPAWVGDIGGGIDSWWSKWLRLWWRRGDGSARSGWRLPMYSSSSSVLLA